jgi:hypothetical protein
MLFKEATTEKRFLLTRRIKRNIYHSSKNIQVNEYIHPFLLSYEQSDAIALSCIIMIVWSDPYDPLKYYEANADTL